MDHILSPIFDRLARRPRVEPVQDQIRITIRGRPIADTTHAVRIVEAAGGPVYYVPRADIDLSSLRENSESSFCKWKGQATYFDFVDGDRSIESVAWAYPDPKSGFEAIASHLAFYESRVDQMVGPLKGEPGSSR